MNTTDLLRDLTGPRPTFGDRYSTAHAAIHEVEQRIELARFFFDLDEERFGTVIADLEVHLHHWSSELAAATRDRQAADACSVRMRGSTVSGRSRGPRLPLGPVPPAPRTSVRARGTRRLATGRPKAQATRSSARSGDSGDDGLGESDEPPSRRRLYACGCGEDISHRAAQARYLNDTHAAAAHQRNKRVRDDKPKTADAALMCEFRPGEMEILRQYSLCRCNGQHILDDDEELGKRCVRCGRRGPDDSALHRQLIQGFFARLAQDERGGRMSGEANPAVRAGLATVGLYDREGTSRLGHDVADCPCCGQMMRVDGWAFRCYAQCAPEAIAARLRFVTAVRSAA